MFTKRRDDSKKGPHLIAKVLDPRKESYSRMRALCHLIVSEHFQSKAELKKFVESSHREIFYIFHDNFIQIESLMKQRVNKFHMIEMNCALLILDVIIAFLPKLLGNKLWNYNSLVFIFQKLTASSNKLNYRINGIRLFLRWFQLLTPITPPEAIDLFSSLIPSISFSSSLSHSRPSTGKISCSSIVCSVPSQTCDKTPEQTNIDIFKAFLYLMSQEVMRIDWEGEEERRDRAFEFLFTNFHKFYLSRIFPDFSSDSFSLQPSTELLTQSYVNSSTNSTSRFNLLVHEAVIRWLAHHLRFNPDKRASLKCALSNSTSSLADVTEMHDLGFALRHSETPSVMGNQQCQSNINFVRRALTNEENENLTQLMRRVLLSSKSNYVLVVLYILKRSFLMPIHFEHCMLSVLMLLKEWFISITDSNNVPEFLDVLKKGEFSMDHQHFYIYFLTNTANVFLMNPSPDSALMESQLTVCNRVIVLYHYVASNLPLSQQTWKQMISVLMHIISSILPDNTFESSTKPSPTWVLFSNKLENILFESVLVATIRGFLATKINSDLLNKLTRFLSSRNNSSALVTEWSKTILSLTKVMALHVYDINMSSLPLDMIVERKEKIKQKAIPLVLQNQLHVEQTDNRVWGSLSGIVTVPNFIEKSAVEIPTEAPKKQHSENLDRQESVTSPSSNVFDGFQNFRDCDEEDPSLHTDDNEHNPEQSFADDSKDEIDEDFNIAVYEDFMDFGNKSPSSTLAEKIMETLTDSDKPVDSHTNGWNAKVATTIWRLIIGIIGNVNDIRDQAVLTQVYSFLLELTEKFILIRKNQGVSINNCESLPRPDLIPPITFILPWLFDVCFHPLSHKSSQLLAFKNICLILTNTARDSLIDSPKLNIFFTILHEFSLSPDNDIVCNLVSHAPLILSSMLPGLSLFFLDFFEASMRVLSLPADPPSHTSALKTLSILFTLSSTHPNISMMNPHSRELAVVECSDLRERLFQGLISATKSLRDIESKCFALNCVGNVVFAMLCDLSADSSVIEAVDLLLANTKSSNIQVINTSVCLLNLFSHLAGNFTGIIFNLPRHIVETLCASLVILPTMVELTESSYPTYVGLIFCIVNWCMNMSFGTLVESSFSDKIILSNVFKVLMGANSNSILSGAPERQSFSEDTLRPGDSTSDRGIDGPSLTPVIKYVISHMIEHLFMLDGNSALVSLSNETDETGDGSELTTAVLDMPNVQFYISPSENSVFTFIHLPLAESYQENGTAKCRIIVRTLSGRHSIDVYDTNNMIPPCTHVAPQTENTILKDSSHSVGGDKGSGAPPSHPLNKILEEISSSLPESFLGDDTSIDGPDGCPFIPEADYDVIKGAIDSSIQFEREWATLGSTRKKSSKQSSPGATKPGNWNFSTCRSFVNLMGLFRFGRSPPLYLLKKNEKLIRELKYLDSHKCREVFKVAVIFVRSGQEDRQSILSNTEGSEGFNKFISCLGWKVDLKTHSGYMGGLSQQYEGDPRTEVTYYSTSTSEVIFHVSTELSGFIGDFNQRLRHIGNDEVHIVWSEHWRDYRRRIITTDFADVIIVIYPLKSGMFRLQLDVKSNYKFIQCWPLFDGAIVDQYSLPGLVRVAAININRILQQTRQFYVPFFVERDSYFGVILRNYMDDITFGNFCYRSFEPSYV